MPLICGPANSRFTFTGSPCPHLDLAISTTAKTLGEALAHYERHFKVSITPLLEPLENNPSNAGKYFKYQENHETSWIAVDIHIIRNSEEICPKQDLQHPLQESDVVDIGELIC